MKWLSIIASLVAVALAGALFVPSLVAQQPFLAGGAAGAGLLCLIASLLRKDAPMEEPVRAATLPTASANQPHAEADVVTFLGLLQEKGRFVDFLMDDITAFNDAQLGAAARVVHQGCQTVLSEHVSVEAVSTEEEGTSLELPEGYSAADYRLLGNVTGQAPFIGTLVHKGWKATQVNLPTVITSGYELPNIAPAQVELS